MSKNSILKGLQLSAVAAFGIPLLAVAPVPEAQAQTYYGAITYSQSSGTHGYSYDYSTRAAAENRALNECEQASGYGDCSVLVWFRNACGALAEAYDGAYGSGWGSDRVLAERNALETCSQYGKGCSVTRWVCTTR